MQLLRLLAVKKPHDSLVAGNLLIVSISKNLVSWLDYYTVAVGLPEIKLYSAVYTKRGMYGLSSLTVQDVPKKCQTLKIKKLWISLSETTLSFQFET